LFGKGTGPPGTRGNWHNGKTQESLNPDLNHSPPVGPHWDYSKGKNTDRRSWRLFPDGKFEEKLKRNS
jgi:hypothetical protein